MNPLILAKAAPWIIAAALGLLLALMTHLYMGERDAMATEKANYATFTAKVKLEGERAEAAKQKAETEHAQNLAQIKEEHESQIPRVRADAVANYRASLGLRQRSAANPGRGVLPGNGAGIRVDDGTLCKQIPDDAFIQDAAEDAAKLEAWQQYCRMNRCPVSE